MTGSLFGVAALEVDTGSFPVIVATAALGVVVSLLPSTAAALVPA